MVVVVEGGGRDGGDDDKNENIITATANPCLVFTMCSTAPVAGTVT